MYCGPWALCLLWFMDNSAQPGPRAGRPKTRELPTLPPIGEWAPMNNPRILEIFSFFGSGQEGKILSSVLPSPVWGQDENCWCEKMSPSLTPIKFRFSKVTIGGKMIWVLCPQSWIPSATITLFYVEPHSSHTKTGLRVRAVKKTSEKDSKHRIPQIHDTKEPLTTEDVCS